MNSGTFVKVANRKDITDSQMREVQVAGQNVCIANIEGQYYAINNTCSHEGGPLADGKLEGYEVECPWHQSKFDVRTGDVKAPPATKPQAIYQIKIEGDDIMIRLDSGKEEGTQLGKGAESSEYSLLLQERQAFSFSYYECIDENGNPLNKLIQAPDELTYKKLFWSNLVGNLTGIYDSQILGKIEISSIRKRQDWMVWLTILKQIKKAKPVPESLAYYRVRENSISSSKWTLIKHNYKVYKDFHHQNFLLASFCMVGFLFTHFFSKPKYVKRLA